jgi:hypothetical protein
MLKHDFVQRGQSYSQSHSASFGEPFRSPMNNYWMTNKAMQRTAPRSDA